MNRPRRGRRSVLVAAQAVLAAMLTACSPSPPPTVPRARATEPSVYVAIGNGEVAGNGVPNRIRHAWPQLVYRSEFPRHAVFVNFGQNNVSAAEALTGQVPRALALRPTVATVHLTEDDFLTGDAEGYSRDLVAVIRRLQRGGRTLVVVGNFPPGDSEPGIQACLPDPPEPATPCEIRPFDAGEIAASDTTFNAAVAAAVAATGATLVDLHGALLRERDRGREASLWAGNLWSPNEAGHRFVAREFARGIRTARRAAAG